jgi:hypothetical protein
MTTSEKNLLIADIKIIGTLFGKTDNCEFYTTISKFKKGNTIHYWFICGNNFEFKYELTHKHQQPNITDEIRQKWFEFYTRNS